jgi:hypothetical protein
MSLQSLLFRKPNSKYTKRNKKDKLYVNSIILTLCLFVTLFLFIFLFCFSVCILNLILKILGIVKTCLVNTHNSVLIFFATYILNYWKWYHCSILGIGSLDIYAIRLPQNRKK